MEKKTHEEPIKEVNPEEPFEDHEEQAHLKAVDSLRDVSRMERDYQTIGEKYRSYLVFDYKERIKKLKAAIKENQTCLSKVAGKYYGLFKSFKMPNGEVQLEPLFVDGKDISKMRSTIKQFVREWAAEGKEERDATYQPIIDEFVKMFPSPFFANGERVKVLVPGCGLGRLPFELAVKGYASQGNEFSYFMLIASNYLLNLTTKKEEFTIYPFIHNLSNNFTESQPFKAVKVPDVFPADLLTPTSDFSMTAGEFVEVYARQTKSWDSIITCFFIDTANNILQYIDVISRILKEGGVWINFGPLLYHYTEMHSECSIELSWEELKLILPKFGFKIVVFLSITNKFNSKNPCDNADIPGKVIL